MSNKVEATFGPYDSGKHYCDSCDVARATNIKWRKTIEDAVLTLYFCGHHQNEFELKLLEQGFTPLRVTT